MAPTLVVAWFAAGVFSILMAIDAARRPASDFEDVGQSKQVWLPVVILGFFIGPLAYYFYVRKPIVAEVDDSDSGGSPASTSRSFWHTPRGGLAMVVFPFATVQILKHVASGVFPDWARLLPEGAIPGVGGWINTVTDYLKNDEILGLFNFRSLTRSIAGLMDWPLDFLDGVLRTGDGPWGIPAVPWIMVVGLFVVAGWYLDGWKLALISGAGVFYMVLFGMWDDSMRTMATVFVSVPVAAGFGFALGLLAARKRWFERVIIPVLNVMQAFPHFSYLLPVVVFVGLTPKAGVIATIIYAFPPMTRLTILGIRGIPPEIIEAGQMSGATSSQMLWKVELPAARRALMVGVNQVIMGCLGMVVIASFIGLSGLGLTLKQALGSLKIGVGLELGIAVVLIAVVLDRLSQAWSTREPEHREEVDHLERFKFGYAALGVIVVSVVLAQFTDRFSRGPKFDKEWAITFSSFTDSIVDWVQVNLPVIELRDFLLADILLPMRSAFLATPWVAGVALIAGLGWALRGPALAAGASSFVLVLAFSGYWHAAMETSYLVVAAVFVCTVFGIPMGIWAARTRLRSSIMNVGLDTFQTLPSFIYLLPVIMLFRIGPVAAVTAMIVYPTVPAIRYTMLGLKGVPLDKIEAARTSGCTERQILWKVKMPLALPEILLGLNQTILYSLFMVMIAAFIGGIQGLGDPLLLSLTNFDMGSGIVIGLCVASLGLTADKLITSWATDRKAQLGLN